MRKGNRCLYRKQSGYTPLPSEPTFHILQQLIQFTRRNAIEETGAASVVCFIGTASSIVTVLIGRLDVVVVPCQLHHNNQTDEQLEIFFPHPCYSSKLLQLPKRDNPEQWPLRQQQNNPTSKYNVDFDDHCNPHKRCPPHRETSQIDERDDRDVWSLVESDPMDGDVTDLPTPVPIKSSNKVWSPDSLGWSSSEEDNARVDDVGRFETSPMGSSSWKSGQPFCGARDAPPTSSRFWEELPEEGDGFTVRRPTGYSKQFKSRRLQEQTPHLKRNQPTNAVY